jgi:iron-sulfur cluster repair protein YtfE (RIC family)
MSAEHPIVKFTVNAAFFREIKEDHQQLQCLLDRLREMTQQLPALENHRREFAALLTDMRDQLALHFTLEEAYGYFEDVIERAPRFHSQAGKLRAQHEKLYVMAQELVEKAGGRFDTEDLADQFTLFDTALKSHESAELKLILDAIQQDVGEGD